MHKLVHTRANMFLDRIGLDWEFLRRMSKLIADAD